jgi:hypothetical protein
LEQPPEPGTAVAAAVVGDGMFEQVSGNMFLFMTGSINIFNDITCSLDYAHIVLLTSIWMH